MTRPDGDIAHRTDASQARAARADRPRAALLLVAHGTRDSAGITAVDALCRVVAASRPGLTVAAAFLDHAHPTPQEAIARLPDGPVVVVPLLVGEGYHAMVDVPTATASDGVQRPRRVLYQATPLGPSRRLLDAVLDQLAEAGIDGASGLVLAAAGSADPRGNAAAGHAAAQLAELRGAPVTVGYCSAAKPTIADAIAGLRRAGCAEVAIASYLLWPGHFQQQLSTHGVPTSAPIGSHPAVANLVLHRFDTAIR